MLKIVPLLPWRSPVPLLLVLLLSSGCATSSPPLTGLIPGRQIQTLQSGLSISLKQGDETRGARGYLLYQRPDQFHLAILSPFGQSLLDLYSWGDTLTCVFPRDRIAYAGNIHELSEQQGARLWGLMQWLVELPAFNLLTGAERENVISSDTRQKLEYDERGLIRRRVSNQGDQAIYSDYRNVDGIAFPLSVEFADMHGNVIALTFDEPELNRPVENETLVPHLGKLQVFPLTYFKGF